MRTRFIFGALFLALTSVYILPTGAQEEDVRGAFMVSRPRTSDKSGPAKRPSHRRPKPDATSPTPTKPVTPVTGPNAGTSRTAKPRMGLGLTLFMRDSNGLAIRTDPAREFRKGDRVRVLLETNADGYLYVFNTTNDGAPVMIYPDPDLDEAGNYIQGHVPVEIPSSMAAEERLKWFTFDQYAGAEKLYFVFTREPLSGVPMEDDLITYCRENAGKCPWSPAPALWDQIKRELNEPIKVAKSDNMGTAQTAGERQGATRGIGLNRDDPEPSLITLTSSTSKNILVTTINLVHKTEVGTAASDPESLSNQE